MSSLSFEKYFFFARVAGTIDFKEKLRTLTVGGSYSGSTSISSGNFISTHKPTSALLFLFSDNNDLLILIQQGPFTLLLTINNSNAVYDVPMTYLNVSPYQSGSIYSFKLNLKLYRTLKYFLVSLGISPISNTYFISTISPSY